MNNQYKILEIFESSYYAKLAVKNNQKYINEKPFPHIIFDNFLPPKLADLIGEQYENFDKSKSKGKYHNNKNTQRYLHEDITSFSLPLKLFASSINGRSFLSFLETLTSINHIIPDPYFIGGGACLTSKGGYLKVHIDFNFHHKLQSWRKLNALFYLNKKWKKEWKGNLELWSTNGKKKVKEIEPKFNRVVIFNTTSLSYHGQPEPINCPTNEYRKVFSAFFYSSHADTKNLEDPHFTKYNIEQSPYSKQILEDYKKK